MASLIFSYQNRENSLYLKNNTKYKNNVIVSKLVPPPDLDSFTPQQSNNVINKNMARVKQPQRNPLRQYRRELTIDTADKNSHNISKQIVNDFNLPGRAITVNNKDSCPDCNGNSKGLFFKEEIYPNNDKFAKGTGYYDPNNHVWKCIACNPETNVIKTASTIISKEYSSSNRQFLQKRCKTYQQNIYCKNTQCIPGQGIPGQDTSNCSTQCTNNISGNGNINNAIGAVSAGAYQYGKFYRNINGSYTVVNNKICKECNLPVLYKKDGKINCCGCCPLNNPNPSTARRKCRF